MNENQFESISKFKFLDIVFLLLRWRKLIILVLGISLILGVLLVLVVPRQYKSVARVLPPKDANILSGLSGVASLARSLPGALSRFGKTDDSYDYIALLKSRTVMEEVIRKFDLMKTYEVNDNSMEKALKQLQNNVEVDWTEENTLELRVWDYDKQRAADISNYFITMLNRRNYELQTKEAKNTRQFIELRLKQNKDDLHSAEHALQEYQEKEKIIIATDPSSNSISSFADLYAMKVKKEMELNVLLETVGQNNPSYLQAKLEFDILNSKVVKFPEIGIRSLQLYREVLIQQKIMELVIPLYEQARVNENKDIPVAYLLDTAVPAERPDRPKRVFILGISFFLGMVIAFTIIGLKEYINYLKMHQEDQWNRIKELKGVFESIKKKNA